MDTGCKSPSGRPNILFIFTDDQQYDAYGANSSSSIQTPVLNELAERGMRFNNAHAALSLCSPSRAAVLTGHYGSVNGVETLATRLNPGEISFTQELARTGYQTLFSGKWHLGDSPADLGFQRACYFEGNGPYHNRKIHDESETVFPAEHVDLYCARKSAEMIRDAARSDAPFILFHCTQLPHMDHRFEWPAAEAFQELYNAETMPLPKNWNDQLANKPEYLKTVRNRTQATLYGYDNPENIRRHAKDYYAVISEMDSYLEHVLDAVKLSGLEDNTVVIFMSDNGWMLGDHGMTSKVLPYTASTHVPLVICGPGIPAGTCDVPVLNLDLTNTIYELAGTTPRQDMHGISLLPMLYGQSCERTVIHECLGGFGGNDPFLAAINERWLYVQTVSPDDRDRVTFEELYDKEEDVWEMTNLVESESHTEILNTLRSAIDHHRKTVLSQALSASQI